MSMLRGSFLRVCILISCIAGCIFWTFFSAQRYVGVTFFMIFCAGPLLVVLDKLSPMVNHLWQHRTETTIRVIVLLWLYTLVPLSVSNMSGYIWNFSCMYLVAWVAVMKFAVRPTQWLRHDHRIHTGFIALLIGAIVLEIVLRPIHKSLGSWLLGTMLIVVLIIWRHILWYHANGALSAKQHRDVWPALAKRSTPEVFWRNIYSYTSQYASQLLILNSLDLSVLLSFFVFHDRFVKLGSDKPVFSKDFCQCVKLAINAKEPRAEFVWQLYNDKDAAALIENMSNASALHEHEHELIDLPDF